MKIFKHLLKLKFKVNYLTDEPRIPLPDGVEKRDVKLYGIAGWISQPEIIECAAFGGYFRYDPLDKKVLDGQLIDCWGSSSIEGRFDEKTLSFTKWYDKRRYSIDYLFHLKDGAWEGVYASLPTGTGRAKCKIFLIEEDAFQIACGSPVPIENSYERQGHLETAPDESQTTAEDKTPF